MNELVRFRTRDGLYLTGTAYAALRVRPGPPTATETFMLGAGTSQPPLTNGSTLEVVVPGPAAPSNFRWTMVSHFVTGGGPEHVAGFGFGGPGVNSEVYVFDVGGSGIFRNEFGAVVNGNEVSISVAGFTRDWFFRVDSDHVVRAVGTTPFLDDTTFVFELGPFCAAVTGLVRDALSLNAIASAGVVTDGGFAGTTAAPGRPGRFALADAAGATCIPEGAHVLTASADRYQSVQQVILVPGAGTVDTVIDLVCTVV